MRQTEKTSKSNVSTKTSTSNQTNTKDIQIKRDIQKKTYILPLPPPPPTSCYASSMRLNQMRTKDI